MTAFTDEQAGLRDAVQRLVAQRADSAAVRQAASLPRGYDEALWQVLCEQIGVAALSLPERFGGLGAGAVETHIVLDELGAALAPSPLLGSAVLAGQLLLALGEDAVCERLLPGIAAGTAIAAVAWAGVDGRWAVDEAACTAGADGRLSGTAHYVLDGEHADVLLVVARDDGGIGVFEVDTALPGVTRVRTPTMDPTRRLASVALDGVPARRVGTGDAGAALTAARDRACIALSAEQVGGATRILARTVDYTKARVQFGRAIGSFQALKHRMADLHVLVESARSVSYAAADGSVDAAVAKVYCSEVYFTVAAECIQLHGGIAITWEHDAHLYLKRAHGSAQLFGQPSQHLTRLAAAVGL